MKVLQLWLGSGAVLLALLIVAGCSSQLSTAPTDTTGRVFSPPIHVNFTRAGVAYTPAQVRQAYGLTALPATNTGAGQTIAIVDAYGSPTIQKDLNTFCSTFSLPATTISIVYPGGKPSGTNSGWALETALDVEWAHAVAPGAKILLVVSPSDYDAPLMQAVDYAARNAGQVSMSWGGPEDPTLIPLDSHFAVPGVTFLAASGDSGAGAEWPASVPTVVGVGGTTLTLDRTNNRLQETGWSYSGGGQSAIEPIPAFQTLWQTSRLRQTPDVSYNADPNTGFRVYDTTRYSGYSGWFVVGGTSAGAPQWAGLIAIANSLRTTRLANANATLYKLGTPTAFPTQLVDIISGNNGSYTAGVGYDMVTGLGSPRANLLIPALVAAR